VIDDSQEDRDLIITHIKKSKKRTKVETEESNCLKDALKKIKTRDYDVIILDLVLPESDGIETVKTVLSTLKELKKDIPVIERLFNQRRNTIKRLNKSIKFCCLQWQWKKISFNLVQ